MKITDHGGGGQERIANLIIGTPAFWDGQSRRVNVQSNIPPRSAHHADRFTHLANGDDGPLQQSSFLERIEVVQPIGAANEFCNEIRRYRHKATLIIQEGRVNVWRAVGIRRTSFYRKM
ncbi:MULTISPECIES: hypothetical protein [Rhizobium/Agrobacterium group]|uniref:Uncharacterized protein n=1 Tax=Agrobacterium vitis TaxID=373 RepID=A0ABD6HA94_AGRVI|nr:MULTISPECIES: hypothetical protein [Rhizobium/Agrobacterium group]MUO42183.1 hypothetical protein [Agrobacterium vitis]MUP10902.1 hypothetical protein [Agrobacterium vitis]